MHDKCPHCNQQWEREEGYFVGAMYFSYALALAFLLPAMLILQVIFPKMDPMLAATVALFLFLPLVPLVFRYSRILWMYFDYWACPSDKTSVPKERR